MSTWAGNAVFSRVHFSDSPVLSSCCQTKPWLDSVRQSGRCPRKLKIALQGSKECEKELKRKLSDQVAGEPVKQRARALIKEGWWWRLRELPATLEFDRGEAELRKGSNRLASDVFTRSPRHSRSPIHLEARSSSQCAEGSEEEVSSARTCAQRAETPLSSQYQIEDQESAEDRKVRSCAGQSRPSELSSHQISQEGAKSTFRSSSEQVRAELPSNLSECESCQVVVTRNSRRCEPKPPAEAHTRRFRHGC